MDFLFENRSSLLFLLGIVMLIMVLMRRWQRYYRRGRPSKRDARNAALREANAQQPLIDAPPELLRWQVEMHETARDLKAELDTKIAVLQRLTIDARQQSDRLDALIKRAESSAIETSVVRDV